MIPKILETNGFAQWGDLPKKHNVLVKNAIIVLETCNKTLPLPEDQPQPPSDGSFCVIQCLSAGETNMERYSHSTL